MLVHKIYNLFGMSCSSGKWRKIKKGFCFKEFFFFFASKSFCFDFFFLLVIWYNNDEAETKSFEQFVGENIENGKIKGALIPGQGTCGTFQSFPVISSHFSWRHSKSKLWTVRLTLERLKKDFYTGHSSFTHWFLC